jgi:hypothetical protein
MMMMWRTMLNAYFVMECIQRIQKVKNGCSEQNTLNGGMKNVQQCVCDLCLQ